MLRVGSILLAVAALTPTNVQAKHAHQQMRVSRTIQAEQGAWWEPIFRVRGQEAAHPVGDRPLLAVAQRYVGRGKFTHYRGPWCRDFVNVVARQAGYHLRNTSRRAIDALSLGHRVSNPQPGDLVVMRHHVTIYAGREAGKVVGLGGNQSHRVRYSTYSARKVLAFVRL